MRLNVSNLVYGANVKDKAVSVGYRGVALTLCR